MEIVENSCYIPSEWCRAQFFHSWVSLSKSLTKTMGEMITIHNCFGFFNLHPLPLASWNTGKHGLQPGQSLLTFQWHECFPPAWVLKQIQSSIVSAAINTLHTIYYCNAMICRMWVIICLTRCSSLWILCSFVMFLVRTCTQSLRCLALVASVWTFHNPTWAWKIIAARPAPTSACIRIQSSGLWLCKYGA